MRSFNFSINSFDALMKPTKRPVFLTGFAAAASSAACFFKDSIAVGAGPVRR